MRYLVDTDVLIDALRGVEQAQDFIRHNSEAIIISTLTIAELYAGARNTKEERTLAELLAIFSTSGITEKIAEKAGKYRHQYGKSHGTCLVDALLAASAEAENATLVTLNKKHYPMLGKIEVPYTKG